MENKSSVPEVKVHQQTNPYFGKVFKVNTYNIKNDELIHTERVLIESSEELSKTIKYIEHYNTTLAYINGSRETYKKLVIE